MSSGQRNFIENMFQFVVSMGIKDFFYTFIDQTAFSKIAMAYSFWKKKSNTTVLTVGLAPLGHSIETEDFSES